MPEPSGREDHSRLYFPHEIGESFDRISGEVETAKQNEWKAVLQASAQSVERVWRGSDFNIDYWLNEATTNIGELARTLTRPGYESANPLGIGDTRDIILNALLYIQTKVSYRKATPLSRHHPNYVPRPGRLDDMSQLMGWESYYPESFQSFREKVASFAKLQELGKDGLYDWEREAIENGTFNN